MEYTQWDLSDIVLEKLGVGLNPCCNGIYSMSCSLQQSKYTL